MLLNRPACWRLWASHAVSTTAASILSFSWRKYPHLGVLTRAQDSKSQSVYLCVHEGEEEVRGSCTPWFGLSGKKSAASFVWLKNVCKNTIFFLSDKQSEHNANCFSNAIQSSLLQDSQIVLKYVFALEPRFQMPQSSVSTTCSSFVDETLSL